jgi:hypothetical protein
MLRVPDFKVREIFLLLGASEENVDRLVAIYQTRHTQPLPLEDRIFYFNFIGIEDSWERIVHTIRADDLESLIDFLITQPTETLTYRRGVAKLCQFIFAPNMLEQLEEIWHKHSFHAHDPRETWNKALALAREKDRRGCLEEDLISQLFEMKGKTPLIIEIMGTYSGQKKTCSPGNWRPLNLQERAAITKNAGKAFEGWMKDRSTVDDDVVKSTEILEFEAFIRNLQVRAKTPRHIQAIFACIQRFETGRNIALPELMTRVRRDFFEKLIEPYRSTW